MIGPVEMGALLKKIRLSKNLTLKELASDYLSVSFLSKFERVLGSISCSISKSTPAFNVTDTTSYKQRQSHLIRQTEGFHAILNNRYSL